MRSWMRAVAVGVAMGAGIGVTAAPVEAQPVGYGIVGPAGVTGFFRTSVANGHAAGGVEVLAGGRVGGQGEFGVIAGEGGGLFVTSGNGIVRLGAADDPVAPFVTAGYTRMFSGEGGFDAWNAGAGADVWLKPHVGVRFEFRDHVRPDSRGTVHYWTFRAGVSFR
jgi:hypothetical protein